MQVVCFIQVTKLVRSNELSVTDRQLVFEAIGFKFLARLLRTGNSFSLHDEYYYYYLFLSKGIRLFVCFRVVKAAHSF